MRGGAAPGRPSRAPPPPPAPPLRRFSLSDRSHVACFNMGAAEDGDVLMSWSDLYALYEVRRAWRGQAAAAARAGSWAVLAAAAAGAGPGLGCSGRGRAAALAPGAGELRLPRPPLAAGFPTAAAAARRTQQRGADACLPPATPARPHR
jgi:hypothetical protein